jgi:hypothetical protein
MELLLEQGNAWETSLLKEEMKRRITGSERCYRAESLSEALWESGAGMPGQGVPGRRLRVEDAQVALKCTRGWTSFFERRAEAVLDRRP